MDCKFHRIKAFQGQDILASVCFGFGEGKRGPRKGCLVGAQIRSHELTPWPFHPYIVWSWGKSLRHRKVVSHL